MHLPSFLWLWRFAAWSMGLSLATYALLLATGLLVRGARRGRRPYGLLGRLHLGAGLTLVGLTLFLLAIGIVGTLGHFGSLGHSPHLGAGLAVVAIVLTLAASASAMRRRRPWARPVHFGAGGLLAFGFMTVLATGWQVVQKYLPPDWLNPK